MQLTTWPRRHNVCFRARFNEEGRFVGWDYYSIVPGPLHYGTLKG